jgi:hypothetical protein
MIPAELIDEFGELSKLRDSFAATERRYQKTRAAIAAIVKDAPGDAAFGQSGERFKLDVSACRMEHPVDVKKARKKLGWATFLQVCTVTKSALEAFLVKPEIEALCLSSQTGPRTFTATPLGDEAQAA